LEENAFLVYDWDVQHQTIRFVLKNLHQQAYPVKFLIAGFGSIGRRHLNNLRALGENNIVLYRTHHSTLSDEDIRDIPTETSLEAALAHQPDGVIIANPTALHLDVAIPAAQAGCAILMEKPISDGYERIDQLQAALQSGGGRLLMGFQFRFHPTLARIAAWLQEEQIGKVISARVHWGEYLPGWHPWEDYRKSYSARADLGGGVINTLSHPLDYLHWLLGEASGLFAASSNISNLGLEVEDNAEILLTYKNGAIASVHLDYVQRPPHHDLEIVGDAGTIQWSNATAGARIYRANTGEWQEEPAPAGFERNQLFLDEMAHFIEVTKKQVAPSCDLNDGLTALKLAEAAYRSANSHEFIHF